MEVVHHAMDIDPCLGEWIGKVPGPADVSPQVLWVWTALACSFAWKTRQHHYISILGCRPLRLNRSTISSEWRAMLVEKELHGLSQKPPVAFRLLAKRKCPGPVTQGTLRWRVHLPTCSTSFMARQPSGSLINWPLS